MLRRVKDFENYILRARDGDIGKAKEFLFDDHEWTVRYLVVDTGSWLSSRNVLISPHALNPAIDSDDVIPIDLTKQQIEASPTLESDEPVSRQFEQQYHMFYGWPYYGGGPYLWGGSSYLWAGGISSGSAGQSLAADTVPTDEILCREATWDPNLRSTKEVSGYHAQALDGEIGHVEDFIIDEDNWSIRYLIVDTKNWLPGKHVLISPRWIEKCVWDERKVFVSLSRESILQSPEYSPETLNLGYEEKLHEHYNSHGYWENRPGRPEPFAKSAEPVKAAK